MKVSTWRNSADITFSSSRGRTFLRSTRHGREFGVSRRDTHKQRRVSLITTMSTDGLNGDTSPAPAASRKSSISGTRCRWEARAYLRRNYGRIFLVLAKTRRKIKYLG